MNSAPANVGAVEPGLRPEVPGYEILHRIGMGACGEVWLVRNAFGTLRAAKVVRRARFEDDLPYEREFDGVRRYEPVSLTHEGLIPILHVGRDDAACVFYYIMELADADGDEPMEATAYRPHTLAGELEQRGRLPLPDCLDWGLRLAAALDHLHQRRLVHRDVKPANILFVGGRPRLADVGLVTESDSSESYVGTTGYIPREGPGAFRADVFGLGKVLYQMLEGRSCEEYPAATTDTLVSGEAMRRAEFWKVIEKACEKDCRKRHASAGALRDELLLVMGGKSLHPLRAIGWVRAHWLPLCGLLAAIGMVAGREVSVKAKAARDRQREQQRQALLQEMLPGRLTPHTAGWSQATWQLVRQAAQIRADDALRDQAAAALAGLDARLLAQFEVEGSWAAFDREGRRLLVDLSKGGVGSWNGTRARIETVASDGDGPVGFRADGAAVQFVRNGDGVFAIRDLGKRDAMRALNAVPGLPSVVDARQPVWQTLTPDGAYAAAAVGGGDGKATIAMWRTDSGELLLSCQANASALALAPDGSMLGVGGDDGAITVHSIADGAAIALPRDDRAAIKSLALHRDPRVTDRGGGRGWLIAAGDAGGTIRIWDVAKGQLRARLSGSEYDVQSVAFSPDGTTLASAGRSQGRLWDTATGGLLLNLEAIDNVRSLAFSPDGKRLAACCEKLFSPGKICVWEVESGRGIQTLRGLPAHVSKVIFSPDGGWLAALAHNWQIAIWERPGGHLRCVLEAPMGFTADNAGLAFSADGGAFACVAGREAKVWDTATWRERIAVPLPAGFVDVLVPHASGKLLAFRLENLDGPRVGRIRDLLSATPAAPIAEIADFDRHIFAAVATPDGSTFIAEGLSKQPDHPRALKAFDALTGRVRWEIPLGTKFNFGDVLIDPPGTVVCARLAEDFCQLISVATGKPLPGIAWPPGPRAIGPRGEWRTMPEQHGASLRGWSLFHRDSATPRVTLGIDSLHSSAFAEFDPSGNFLAWGNDDGSVSVCDLHEIGRRLHEAGLGWQDASAGNIPGWP